MRFGWLSVATCLRTRRLRYSAPSFIFSKETLPIIKFPLPINALSMRKAGNNPYI